VPFLSKHLLRASHLLRELLVRLVGALVCCLYLDLVFRLKVYKTAVFVNVTLFFLLCECDVTLSHALYVIYTLGELYSLFLVKLFTSVCWCLWLIPVLGCTRLKTLEELKRAYSNTLVI
jgi:hypothetical protein